MPTTAPSTRTEEPRAASTTEQQEKLAEEVRATRASAVPAEAIAPARGPQKRPAPLPVAAVGRDRRLPEIFYGSLLDFSPTRHRRATKDFIVSIVLHSMIIGFFVLVPLMFTEAIDLSQFTHTLLVAPPPPPPPPPPPQMVTRARPPVKREFSVAGKLIAPTVIPESVAMLHEKPLPPELDNTGAGVVGGVPGGIPGGQAGGVLGSILSGALQKAPLAPPPAAHAAPIRVGGQVKPPRKIYAPPPEYPVLAKQAHIEGTVVIDAVIDASGNVVEAKVVSGPPLLYMSAMEAIRQWKFEPTYLNGEPVPVRFMVTIEFQLSR
jgi:protein TonB